LPRPAVIDEVQRVPSLMLAVKQILDNDPRLASFCSRGRPTCLTARVVADALPGRVEYLHLWPLARARDRRPNVIR